MKSEKRLIYFDVDLQLEAFQLSGIVQSFPNHFHDYYVLGYIVNGNRNLFCKDREYNLVKKDIVLFNPLDSHNCIQVNNAPLDWRGFNIDKDTMKNLIKKVIGSNYLPKFYETVFCDEKLFSLLNALHKMIINQDTYSKKENILFSIIEALVSNYTSFSENFNYGKNHKVEHICNCIKDNYDQTISLDNLSKISNINKYTLLRLFSKQKGVTPYQYLETVRISEAKKLLETNIPIIDVAIQTGFVDQSHFSKLFKSLIGLTPKQYQNISR